MRNRKNFTVKSRYSKGLTLLDIVLAIVIFVIGMLALASLQGNLTRSSTDGKARTVGSNVAEDIIERLRTFSALEATGTCPNTLLGIMDSSTFQCIEGATGSFNRDGIDYDITMNVDDYYFMPDRQSVTKNVGDLPANQDTTISNFKYVQLTVDWGNSTTEFLTNNDQNPTSALGSGSLVVSGIIPSEAPMGAANVAADEEDTGSPPVSYLRGQRPDIVAIDLNGDKFKESTKPVPDVIRRDQLAETWFDVTTYNQGNPDYYQRREEFLVITCECELQQPSGGEATGFLPAVWNGQSYTIGNNGELVSKMYGVSANNQQSMYCDTCCRDHHDSEDHTGADEVYDPVRKANEPKWSEAGGLLGDHKHYKRESGGLVEANVGDDYVEACRMVRKDGFMRVAQDFRQQGFWAFPQGYLDSEQNAGTYSNYITSAVEDFYSPGHGDKVSPPSAFDTDFPADNIAADGNPTNDATTLPYVGLNSQQMRSRALYIDNKSEDLKTLLTCLADNASSEVPGDVCGAPGVTDPIQVLPFFEIQTTWLSNWISTPQGLPVSVTSEAVADNNSHSRGLATLEVPSTTDKVTVDVETDMHRGNIGLTATDDITLADSSETGARSEANLYIDINGGEGDTPATPMTYTWTGTFTSSVNKVDASGVVIDPGTDGNEFCALHGTNQISCATVNGYAGEIAMTGYTKKQGQTYLDLWICPTTQAAGITVVNSPGGANNSATLSWSDGTVATDVVLTIEESACSP